MDLEMESKLKRKSRKLGGANGYKKLEKELALLESNLYLQTNMARARSFKNI